MPGTVDRSSASERAVRAEVAAAWPTGARIPWLPVIDTDEAAGNAAEKSERDGDPPPSGLDVTCR